MHSWENSPPRSQAPDSIQENSSLLTTWSFQINSHKQPPNIAVDCQLPSRHLGVSVTKSFSRCNNRQLSITSLCNPSAPMATDGPPGTHSGIASTFLCCNPCRHLGVSSTKELPTLHQLSAVQRQPLHPTCSTSTPTVPQDPTQESSTHSSVAALRQLSPAPATQGGPP